MSLSNTFALVGKDRARAQIKKALISRPITGYIRHSYFNV